MKNIVANAPLNYQPINVNETEQPLHVGPSSNKPAPLNQMNACPFL